jgi:hypothetical protein
MATATAKATAPAQKAAATKGNKGRRTSNNDGHGYGTSNGDGYGYGVEALLLQ